MKRILVLIGSLLLIGCANKSPVDKLDGATIEDGGVHADLARAVSHVDLARVFEDLAGVDLAGIDLNSPVGIDMQPSSTLPSTCQDVADADPGTVDGEFTVYFNKDPMKPWTVYCVGMTTAGTRAPIEYLTLPMGLATNFSQASSGNDVVTLRFSKIQLDPVTLVVGEGAGTPGQATMFTTKTLATGDCTGGLGEANYGWAGSCDKTAAGLGSVDLRGTPFTFHPNDFVLDPYYTKGVGGAVYSNSNQTVTLSAGGPGQIGPKEIEIAGTNTFSLLY